MVVLITSPAACSTGGIKGDKMNILVVGSGGREHALAWKIAQSKRVEKIWCAPGNAGIAKVAECVDIASDDVEELLAFAQQEKIDLTVVGPEASLAAGIVDAFEKAGLMIFGPSKKASILEGSKVFSKEFMEKYGIPTAKFKVFREPKKAKKYIDKVGAPVVVKADGLAAGKGVIVAATVKEAKAAVEAIMASRQFGDAGERVVVEACLKGEEASFIAFTDGKTVLPLPTSQDHKAAYDGDKGPNTGGMGAYSPAPVVTDAIADFVMTQVMQPTVDGLAAEGRPFKGMLYAGLMIDGTDVKVLEFNCRFGDPECQPLLMRLQSDIVDIFEAACKGELDKVEMKIDPRPAVCVVMASGGYPGTCETGKAIIGLPKAEKVANVEIFHAGTTRIKNRLTNAGGRVLGVTAIGTTLEEAITAAYSAVDMIRWPGCQYRRDIGAKALNRQPAGEIASTETAVSGVQVGIVMGSDSDLPVMRAAADFLKSMGIGCEMTVASAHRTPEKAAEYAKTAEERGLKAIIAGAGMAAHLAGVLAAHTDLPVIGVPLDASSLNGLDALLATVQMPPGVPVATMGIGKAGAKNAGVFVCRMLALTNPELRGKLTDFRQQMADEVEAKAKKVEQEV